MTGAVVGETVVGEAGVGEAGVGATTDCDRLLSFSRSVSQSLSSVAAASLMPFAELPKPSVLKTEGPLRRLFHCTSPTAMDCAIRLASSGVLSMAIVALLRA